MCEVPLTHEQRIFAAKHHDLVYRYLKENHLSKDEFYDVVIFGYINAVRDYLTKPELQKYAFSTICWRAMSRCMSNYYQEQLRKLQDIEIVSIHTALNEGDLPLEDTIPSADNLLQQIEIELLFHKLAKIISKQQMEIVYLRNEGYALHEIASNQKLTIHRVRKQLAEAQAALRALCNE